MRASGKEAPGGRGGGGGDPRLRCVAAFKLHHKGASEEEGVSIMLNRQEWNAQITAHAAPAARLLLVSARTGTECKHGSAARRVASLSVVRWACVDVNCRGISFHAKSPVSNGISGVDVSRAEDATTQAHAVCGRLRNCAARRASYASLFREHRVTQRCENTVTARAWYREFTTRLTCLLKRYSVIGETQAINALP